MGRFTKIPVHVEAGVRDVVVAFVDRSHVLSDENFDKLEDYNGLTGSQAPMDRIAHLRDGVEVAGPFNPTGVSRTPSRRSDLRLRSQNAAAGVFLLQADHGKPGETRLPAAGHRRRHEAPDAVL